MALEGLFNKSSCFYIQDVNLLNNPLRTRPVAQLIADRPPANSITIHSWAVMFGQTSLFARSIKISKSLET